MTGSRINYLFREAKLLVSLIPTDSLAPMHTNQASESLFSSLNRALRTFLTTQDQMETVIAPSEAGDIEGVKALREKHAE